MINYSIVICTYNQKQTLSLALESLRCQIKQPKIFEIVIADDCSSDGTDEFVRKLRYPIFLKYSRADKNLGRAANRNRGFEKAAGKNIICIDGDMVPCPEFIDAYLQAWEEFPQGVILGAFRHPAEMSKSRLSDYLSSRGRLTWPHGARVEGNFFTSTNFSIGRDIFMELSGFDTAFRSWGGEDTDFGIRLGKKSVSLYYIPEAWCFHYHEKTIEEMAREFEEFGQDGFRLLANRYPSDVIYRNGWLFGLPDSRAGIGKKIAALLLRPLWSGPILEILGRLARINQGGLFSDFMFDWLFYGHLARGYRKSKR